MKIIDFLSLFYYKKNATKTKGLKQDTKQYELYEINNLG